MTAALVLHGDPPLYFTFPSLAALGVPHATTTRHCPGIVPGNGPWVAGPFGPEATAVLAGAGLDLARVAYARQVHGADVARPAAGGLAGTADVLATTARRLPLAIVTADCLAVTLYDSGARVLVMAHVGWRGTVRGATGAAVGAAVAAGGRAERLHAAIAPSIGPCCYEVDEPVVTAFAGAFPSRWERWVTPRGPGRVMLDLWAANEDLLRAAGVDAARIENPRLCTACHPEVLHSYRRGTRGRLVTVAALP